MPYKRHALLCDSQPRTSASEASMYTWSAASLALREGRKIGGIRRRYRIPEWRATVDEDGHYSFAIAL